MSEENTISTAVRPRDASAILKVAAKKRKAALLWGPPGIGKSAVVRQTAEELGVGLVDFRAVYLDPVDLRGIPVPDKKTKSTEWYPPNFLPIKGKVHGPGIIFADEIGQGSTAVQASLMQGIQEHRIGEHELDPSWTWVAASNRQEDRAGTNRMISPLLNRFAPHIDMEVSSDDFQEWAVKNGIAPEIRSFLRFKPGHLFNFKPELNEKAFPTPRSWANTSELLPDIPDHLVQRTVAGCVGKGAAAEFCAHRLLYKQLPDIDQVLANPTTTKVPKDEPSVMHSLISALADRVREDKTKAAGYVTYARRMPDEFAMLALTDVLAVDKTVKANPEFQDWQMQAIKKGLFQL